MSDAPIAQVQQAQRPDANAPLPAEALESGALTLFDDGEAVFTGNGQVTPTQVNGRLIEIGAASDAELKPFVDETDAHRFAAQKSLDNKKNATLGIDPDEAIPDGKQYSVPTMDLKSMLAPYKNNLGALRERVAQTKVGMGGPSTTTGAGVFSQGLQLPTATEEPAAQPSDVVIDTPV